MRVLAIVSLVLWCASRSALFAQTRNTLPPPSGTEGTRPLATTEAVEAFRIKKGLKVELVAAEPLVQSPVAIDWSADGKLWVCEMNDYPTGIDGNWQPGGRIKRLTDDDGDGVYDRSELFLEHIPFPTGVTAWGAGVLVCAAPDILYAEDTNGDGKADKVEKLFTAFFTDNYQARVNSLNLGLDNWIYGANGLLGGEIKPVKNSLLRTPNLDPVNIRSRDFRFDPVTGVFQAVSGLTQQGRVRDDWGNWFGCNNSQCLLYFPPGEAYLSRNPHASLADPPRDLTARPDGNRLFPTSPLLERFNEPASANHVTSACGLGIYRDTLLGQNFYGNAFTCEPVHNLVHREVLTRDLVFTSNRASDERDAEFLSSRDNWFRPVQARPGPDGALYVVDMYRFLIEHPRWIPAERLARINVRAGSDRGRIYRVVPSDKPLRPIRNLKSLQGESLAAALDTPNGVDRDRVQIELLTRKDNKAVPRLKDIASKAELPQVRVQALSALAGLNGLSPDQVRAALKDPEPDVRQMGLRLAEPLLRTESNDESATVRAVAALKSDSSLMVLRQLAYTLGESPSLEAGRVLGELARQWISNVEMRRAILSAASRHCGPILQSVLNVGSTVPGRAEWIPPLVATAASSADPKLIAQAIEAALPPEGAEPQEMQIEALSKLLDSRLSGSLDAKATARIALVIETARKIAIDAAQPAHLRTAAIKLVGRDASAADVDLLCKLAADPVEPIRRTAIVALRPARNPAVAKKILGQWPSVSPAARIELVGLFLDREDWTTELLKGIRDGVVQPSELSRADRQRLTNMDKPQIRKLAQELLPAETMTMRAEVLARYKQAGSLKGSGSRGAEVFRKNCASCHALNGIGQSVGPDLSALRARDPDYWIKNILDPNAVIEPRFISYLVDLKDDRTISGLIKHEDTATLTVVGGAGVTETVRRSDVAKIRASTLSLMPEGLEQGIDPNQMADLLAYLREGKPRKEIAGNAPETVKAGNDGVLMLPATKAELFGEHITFEPEFQNIGYWDRPEEYVVWTVEVPEPGRYTLFMDAACASGSAGNRFVVEIGDDSLNGTVAATGSDWSVYRQSALGTLQLNAGLQRVICRPDGPMQGAMFDLRAFALAPAGREPTWPRIIPRSAGRTK